MEKNLIKDFEKDLDLLLKKYEARAIKNNSSFSFVSCFINPETNESTINISLVKSYGTTLSKMGRHLNNRIQTLLIQHQN